jgi:hypothetical protein
MNLDCKKLLVLVESARALQADSIRHERRAMSLPRWALLDLPVALLRVLDNGAGDLWACRPRTTTDASHG